MGFLNLVRLNYRSSAKILPHGYVCFLHFDIVVVDFRLNPITRLSIVTKLASPLIPPVLLNDAPKKSNYATNNNLPTKFHFL